MPQQGMPQQSYPQQGYPQQGMPQQGYPQQGYAPQCVLSIHSSLSLPLFLLIPSFPPSPAPRPIASLAGRASR
jgi:hypothetical protein